MGKSVIVSVAIIILGLIGPASAGAADPNLVGWWKFDGDALDASGQGRNGTLNGDAAFVPGLLDHALALDGSGDYVTIAGYKGILGGRAFSITAWASSTATGDATMVNWGSSTNGQRVDFRLYQGRLRVEHGNGNLQGVTPLNDGEWHHVAVTVKDGASISNPDVKLYLDGKDDTQATTDPDKFNITAVTDVTIGRRGTNSDRAFPGLLDDVRIYDRVLTAEEIDALGVRPKAYQPNPADKTVGVTTPLLRWTPRQTAQWHDVYLGTAPELGPESLVAPHAMGSMYWHVPGLEPGTTYYWRVDEVEPDGTVYPGDVWSFTFASFKAFRPDPPAGTKYVDPNLTLTWMAGLNGVSHDVYFGTDSSAVTEGSGGTFKGNQFLTTLATGALELNTTYYWRIDEVNVVGAKTTGDVWQFSTLPPIAVADPNLVGWWTFDEGSGTRTVDWSGHGHHGRFNPGGTPTWVEGYDGGALAFDGPRSGDFVTTDYAGVTGRHARSTTAWIKTATYGEIISWGQNTAGQKWIFRVQESNGTLGAIRVEVNGGYQVGYTDVRDNEWHHVAAVLDSDGTPDALEIKLYVDGRLESNSAQQDEPIDTINTGVVRIGESPWHNRPFTGLIDDVRVYDKALTQEEVERVMRIDPARAWKPQPVNHSIVDIRTATPLTWAAGDNASKHDVYLGTDAAAVAAATTDTADIYGGRLSAASYEPSEDLAWGGTYFWRVDEVNADGSITAGWVWQFTVADYLIVDDFESYNDEENQGTRIYETWLDGLTNGTNATVGNWNAPFAERTIVHSGAQAMPMDYNNVNSPWYAEAERAWDKPQNWTLNDVDTLVLYFQGQPPAFLETASGALTLSAAGTDIWNAADEFRFAWKRLSGDGSILVRVDSLTNTNGWAKAGVMIRETLDPGSRYAAVEMTPANGVAFQRRLANSATPISTNQTGRAAPHWVKLTRSGSTLTAQHSDDGVTWFDVTSAAGPSSDTLVMAGTIYIGLALTSHSPGVLTTAVFSGLQTTGSVTGPWEVAEIGVAQPGNTPNRLYLAVEDTAGKVAVVTYPDVQATVQTTWQQWAINLDTIRAAGVKVSAVEKMYIGVGDRSQPQPDGTGRIYIDDIRVTKGVPVEPNQPATP